MNNQIELREEKRHKENGNRKAGDKTEREGEEKKGETAHLVFFLQNALHEAAMVTKKKVSAACFLCKTSHSGCDYARPCSRCVRLGMAHMCFDTPAKKRGRKSKNTKLDQQQTGIVHEHH